MKRDRYICTAVYDAATWMATRTPIAFVGVRAATAERTCMHVSQPFRRSRMWLAMQCKVVSFWHTLALTKLICCPLYIRLWAYVAYIYVYYMRIIISFLHHAYILYYCIDILHIYVKDREDWYTLQIAFSVTKRNCHRQPLMNHYFNSFLAPRETYICICIAARSRGHASCAHVAITWIFLCRRVCLYICCTDRINYIISTYATWWRS